MTFEAPDVFLSTCLTTFFKEEKAVQKQSDTSSHEISFMIVVGDPLLQDTLNSLEFIQKI